MGNKYRDHQGVASYAEDDIMTDLDKYYFPGEKKRIRRAKLKGILWTLFISALLFTGIGYTLHYYEVKQKIEHYEKHWVPLQEDPARKRIK